LRPDLQTPAEARFGSRVITALQSLSAFDKDRLDIGRLLGRRGSKGTNREKKQPKRRPVGGEALPTGALYSGRYWN
jgi:hypothetical protein